MASLTGQIAKPEAFLPFAPLVTATAPEMPWIFAFPSAPAAYGFDPELAKLIRFTPRLPTVGTVRLRAP